MNESKPAILIIAGPTAVGKTDASLLLARRHGAEIVSADSMQIYRGMDIGTAKPTAEQRAEVYHHVIDVADPTQLYSVGDYLRDARAAIDGIIASGSIPIVVGGTGLYIRALMKGLFHGPSADLDLREQLLRRESEVGAGALYADLVKVDADAAVRIHPNDLRRTMRALEVYHLRDQKMSTLQREHGFAERTHSFRLIFLTRERAELYRRIEQRVDQMIDVGLEAEVRSLIDRGCTIDMQSMQGLGYKHCIEQFAGRTTRDEAIQLLKRDTRRYAKRQFTWFRREPEAIWVDITGMRRAEDIAEKIVAAVETDSPLG